jgi:amino acid permease
LKPLHRSTHPPRKTVAGKRRFVQRFLEIDGIAQRVCFYWRKLMLFERVKSLEHIIEAAERKGLKRQLGAFDLTMLGIGAIIGTGIFVLTSVAAEKAGPGMMFSFVLAGFVCALAALVYSEIAAIMPVAGW